MIKPWTLKRLEEKERRLEHMDLLLRRMSNFVQEELVETRIERKEANNIAISVKTGIAAEMIHDCRWYRGGMCIHPAMTGPVIPCVELCRYWEDKP